MANYSQPGMRQVNTFLIGESKPEKRANAARVLRSNASLAGVANALGVRISQKEFRTAMGKFTTSEDAEVRESLALSFDEPDGIVRVVERCYPPGDPNTWECSREVGANKAGKKLHLVVLRFHTSRGCENCDENNADEDVSAASSE